MLNTLFRTALPAAAGWAMAEHGALGPRCPTSGGSAATDYGNLRHAYMHHSVALRPPTTTVGPRRR